MPKTRSQRTKDQVLHGRALWMTLGFANERAFQRARVRKELAIALFPMPGSRGVWAKASEVKAFIDARDRKGVPESK